VRGPYYRGGVKRYENASPASERESETTSVWNLKNASLDDKDLTKCAREDERAGRNPTQRSRI